MAEMNLVTEVRMGGLPARYELTPRRHHDHLTCASCGLIVEFESARVTDFQWPYGDSYSIYREHVDFGAVESFSLWYNNLPPGENVSCAVGPVTAMPLAGATKQQFDRMVALGLGGLDKSGVAELTFKGRHA
jgi:hypothetical protein